MPAFPGTVVPKFWYDGRQTQYSDSAGAVPITSGLIRRINESSPLTGAWTPPSDDERPLAEAGSVRLEILGAAGGYELTRPAVSGCVLNAFTLFYSFIPRDCENGSPGMGLIQDDGTVVGLIASGVLWVYHGGSIWFTTLTITTGTINSIIVRYSASDIEASVRANGVTTTQLFSSLGPVTLPATSISAALRIGRAGAAYLHGSVLQGGGVDRTITTGERDALFAWSDGLTAPAAFPDDRSLTDFVGDSITQGVSAAKNLTYAFRALGAIRPTYPLSEVCVTATPGIGLSGLILAGAGTTYYEAKRLYSATRAKNIMCVFFGSNDLAGGRSLDWFLHGTDGAAAGSGVYPLCDDARATGFLVLLVSPPPRTASLSVGVTQLQYDTTRDAISADMVTNWRAHADAFIDLRAIAGLGGPTDPNSTTNYTDGIHWNNTGHGAFAPYATAAIEGLLALVPPYNGKPLYQMQARSSTTGRLYSWSAASPDRSGSGYVARGYPGSPLEIVQL